MNPFTFNVELYHHKNPSKTDPRDILAPDSVRFRRYNILSAVKIFGGLTVRQAGLVAMGGVLAVGCTIRFLRNRRKRIRSEIASTAEHEASQSTKTDAGTQADPLPDPVFSEEVVLAKEDAPLDESLSVDSEKIGESGRNLSDVTQASHDSSTSMCNCVAERAAEGVKQTQLPHQYCNVSAFLALLALHKTIMWEREVSCSTSHDKGQLHEAACQSGTPPLSAIVRKDEDADFFNNSTNEETKHLALVHRMEGPCLRKDKEIHTARGLGIPGKNPTAVPSVQPRTNPFDIRDQRGQTTAHCLSGRQNKLDLTPKGNLPVPQKLFSNHEHRPQNGSACARRSNVGVRSQDVRNLPQSAENSAVSRTIKPRGRADNGKVGFRSNTCSDRGSYPQRGKPQRRGSGRKNVPRRPYVDLDNPKSIVS